MLPVLRFTNVRHGTAMEVRLLADRRAARNRCWQDDAAREDLTMMEQHGGNAERSMQEFAIQDSGTCSSYLLRPEVQAFTRNVSTCGIYLIMAPDEELARSERAPNFILGIPQVYACQALARSLAGARQFALNTPVAVNSGWPLKWQSSQFMQCPCASGMFKGPLHLA